MRAGPVFLDTGIFVAFLDRSDHYHAGAVELFAEAPRRWYTSLAVVSETYGWFLHRFDQETARAFRLMLDDLPRLRLLAIDMTHHRAVCRQLDRFRGHKLTYVDASSLAFLERHAIREVWGTDRDLGLAGARVMPIS